MKIKQSIFIITLSFAIGVALSYKYTEYTEQEKKLKDNYLVVPVPIPNQLTFAEEKVPLDRFEIKERLDRELLVNTYWQSNSLLILKRSKKYFQIIEPILERYGVPSDFKYLAVAESGLLNVTSPAGAKGVWQFMPSSGKAYGLEINNSVDERYHLERSTEAACLYIKEAYSKFGNWTLAAASYNRGMNGISNDIAKQLVNDYYDLHLNTETSRYILRILAFKTIIENPASYGFQIEPKDYYSFTPTINISVDESIPNISEYAQSLGTNYHILKTLNPWIKTNSLDVTDVPYIIKAPLTK